MKSLEVDSEERKEARKGVEAAAEAAEAARAAADAATDAADAATDAATDAAAMEAAAKADAELEKAKAAKEAADAGRDRALAAKVTVKAAADAAAAAAAQAAQQRAADDAAARAANAAAALAQANAAAEAEVQRRAADDAAARAANAAGAAAEGPPDLKLASPPLAAAPAPPADPLDALGRQVSGLGVSDSPVPKAPAAAEAAAAAGPVAAEPSLIQKKTSITIDGKTFTFLAKSSDTSGREYVEMEVGEGDHTLYRSLSHNGFWRHCIEEHMGHLRKGEDYVATTLVDFRLQEFVNSILDSLPSVERWQCNTPEKGNYPKDRATQLEPFATFAKTHLCGSDENRSGYEETLTKDITEFMANVKTLYTFGDYESVYPDFSIDRVLAV